MLTLFLIFLYFFIGVALSTVVYAANRILENKVWHHIAIPDSKQDVYFITFIFWPIMFGCLFFLIVWDFYLEMVDKVCDKVKEAIAKLKDKEE